MPTHPPPPTDYEEDPRNLKAAQKAEDKQAQKEHSNSGSNTSSGQGMEYVTRENHSSRENEEGTGKEEVHKGGGSSGGKRT